MALTKKNLKQHEVIGLHATVKAAQNKVSVGICGKIVDETQKTIAVLQNRQTKRVFKAGTTFEIVLPDKKQVILNGEEILFRPWDRISKCK